MHTGRCLCGAVTFEIDGDLAGIQLCHCAMCRRASGSAFAANMPVRVENFRITAGAAQVKSYASSPGKERLFCAQCGSQLFSRAAAFPDTVRLRAGALDEPADTTAVFHFHTASKASWLPITGDLPQYPGARPPG